MFLKIADGKWANMDKEMGVFLQEIGVLPKSSKGFIGTHFDVEMYSKLFRELKDQDYKLHFSHEGSYLWLRD
jgi:hypothetical protein